MQALNPDLTPQSEPSLEDLKQQVNEGRDLLDKMRVDLNATLEKLKAERAVLMEAKKREVRDLIIKAVVSGAVFIACIAVGVAAGIHLAAFIARVWR